LAVRLLADHVGRAEGFGDPIFAAAPPRRRRSDRPATASAAAWPRVGQDNLRRIMLRERDRPGAARRTSA
jgi:hypothetical protein